MLIDYIQQGSKDGNVQGEKKTVSQVIQTHRESRSKTYHVQYVSLVWWTRPPGHGLKKVYEEIL